MLIADASMTGAMRSIKMINELNSQNSEGNHLETMRKLLKSCTLITNNRTGCQQFDPGNRFLKQGTKF